MGQSKLQTAIGALLNAQDAGELERKIVDVLPGATGFERIAVLAPPTMQNPATVLQSSGYPHLALHPIPGTSPLAPGRFLEVLQAGAEGGADLPHANVRGFYALAPLRERERTVNLVYADSVREGVAPQEAADVLAFALDVAGLVRANFSLSAERERLLAELDELATTDTLTALANRRVLEERMREELHRSSRSRRPFGLALFDIDRFREINDRYGHPAGDEALQHFAATLRGRARHVDFVARFGDDELAMVMVDVDHQAARTIVERILDALRQARLSFPIPLSASAGVALSYPVDTVETLIERADAALYEAKQTGRDRAKVT